MRSEWLHISLAAFTPYVKCEPSPPFLVSDKSVTDSFNMRLTVASKFMELNDWTALILVYSCLQYGSAALCKALQHSS